MRLDGLSNTCSLVQSEYIYLPAVQILLDFAFFVDFAMVVGAGKQNWQCMQHEH